MRSAELGLDFTCVVRVLSSICVICGQVSQANEGKIENKTAKQAAVESKTCLLTSVRWLNWKLVDCE